MKGLDRSPPGLMPLFRALRRLLALALPPLLVVVLTLTPLLPPWLNRLLPGMLQPAQAWNLPRWGERSRSASADAPLEPSAPSGRLQEVSPPEAVQQLQSALADRLPQVQIESPRDGALLPDGTWQLKLKVRDWPLTDAGQLGLGAHVVVQLDDLPPQRLTGATPFQSGQSDRATSLSLVVDEPALSPGSHRLTVYAARPWGEAVKSPGALRQITVNRLLANPLSLPQAGSPQLLAVSPADLSANEPLLLDWILIDAPLQNLRDGDGSWRLRVTINGDRFLMDQNVPLWLRGWKPGRNSLQLELLDGLGQPLNPPFNSLVQEVDLNPPGSETASRPRWLQGRLSTDELARLLGDKPAEATADEEVAGTTVEPDPGPGTPSPQQELPPESVEQNADSRPSDPDPIPDQDQDQDQQEADQDAQNLQLGDQAPTAGPQTDPSPEDTGPVQAEQPVEPNGSDPMPEQPDSTTTPGLIEGPLQESLDLEAQPDHTTPEASPGNASPELGTTDASPLDASTPDSAGAAEQPFDEAPLAQAPLVEDSLAEDSRPQQAALADPLTVEPEPVAPTANTPELDELVDELVDEPASPELTPVQPPLEIAPPQRISSSTPLGAPARQQVNARGELIQAAPTGPLARLRQLLRGS